jgi:hypothetical protein
MMTDAGTMPLADTEDMLLRVHHEGEDAAGSPAR